MDIKIKIGVVVCGENGKALLIKEKLGKKPVPLWNIIKGSYDGGETIFEAAKRECLEEACLDVDLVGSLGAYISEESEKIRIQFNFLARAKNMSAKLANSEEQTSRNEAIEEVCWFTKEEISKMNPNDFVSSRAYELIRDWMVKKEFPIESYKQVRM